MRICTIALGDVAYGKSPRYRNFRPGDIRDSQVDIVKARNLIGYDPKYRVRTGIEQAMLWYLMRLRGSISG